MKKDKFIIGTRGSKLAQIYTEKVTKFLKKVSSTHIEIKQILTSGDENQNDRLSNIGGKGLFSKKSNIFSAGACLILLLDNAGSIP